MSARRAATAAALVVLALAATGCSTVAPGSLVFDERGYDTCVERPDLRDIAVGVALDRESGPPITIDAVTAIGADGVKLVDAVLVEARQPGGEPIGRIDVGPFPPPSAVADGSWPERVPARGAVIEAGDRIDLVLHVTRVAAAGGSIADFEITYAQGARHFDVRVHQPVTLADRC